MDLQNLKYLVVGAGFFGSVVAERIAADLGERVLVIDKRDHTGGNSYSEVDRDTGIECHCYGSHIFHTSNTKVWNYINKFCTFNSYRHKVLSNCRGKIYPMPINLETINAYYGKYLTPLEAQAFIKTEIDRAGIIKPKNLEEKAISLVGKQLYEAFVKEYTIKQWGTDPRNLPDTIITRLPVRINYLTDYFNDPWQGIPLNGYHNIFEKMLYHPLIEVKLNCNFFDIRHYLPTSCCVIYTGPIDRFFDYKYGELGWRTLVFEKEICLTGDFQGTAVMNYADAAVPYTRIHEFKHYKIERFYPDGKSVIYREYSTGIGASLDPFYPVRASRDEVALSCYQQEADKKKNVFFGGRLGSYRYIDMDKAIAEALTLFEEKIKAGVMCPS